MLVNGTIPRHGDGIARGISIRSITTVNKLVNIAALDGDLIPRSVTTLIGSTAENISPNTATLDEYLILDCVAITP